ncbi:carbohydrate ABC transporter permease [Bauldia sp.]|uniref:carbohydrate ABC transporter permease n=1 Tax=Bauldia sp. TaxID=2575872 RepID=UPI003BACFC42
MKTLVNPWIRYSILVVFALLVVVPFASTIFGGFKTLGELQSNPLGPPANWTFENYAAILSGDRFPSYIWNSLYISFLTVSLTLIVSAMAAFAFAQIRFFGSAMLLNFLLLGMLFPVATGILPLFLQLRDLGLLDTYWGVILPQIAFGLGISVLLMRQSFVAQPGDLWEAAQIDGCSYWRFFLSVTLPLALPILTTVGVITLIASWNNYLLPLVVLNSEDTYPWPLGIMRFRSEFGTEWTLVLAFVSLTIVPAVLLYVFAQKFIIAGLTGGAVKG